MIKKKQPLIMHNTSFINISQNLLNDNVQPHIHTYYEIEFFLSGELTATINNISVNATRGTLFFYTPYDIHEYKNCKNANTCKIAIDHSFLSENSSLNSLLYSDSLTITLDDDKLEWLYALFTKMYAESRSAYYLTSQDIMITLTNLFLLYIYRYKGNFKYIPPSNSTITKVLKYISMHYREDISISTLANNVYMSEDHLCRLFKKNIGLNPKRYILNLRLEYAKNMISSSSLSLGDIALKSGFHSLTVFSRQFTKIYGISPSEYRKSL